MISVGVILMLLGLLTGVAFFWSAGLVLLVVGLILLVLGSTGRRVGPRAHYW
jgi:hypothetical protein